MEDDTSSGKRRVTMEDIPAGCVKAFVQRDYSDGMAVKFEKSLPQEGKIPGEQFEQTQRAKSRRFRGESLGIVVVGGGNPRGNLGCK